MTHSPLIIRLKPADIHISLLYFVSAVILNGREPKHMPVIDCYLERAVWVIIFRDDAGLCQSNHLIFLISLTINDQCRKRSISLLSPEMAGSP